MTQLTLAAQLGIPDGASKTFKTDAYGFLVSYARASRGHPFSAEDVVQAALKAGVAPERDLRSWGAVFQTVSKDGFIRRSRQAFQCATSNGSFRLGWVGV